ncbi:hypothetical protein U9M48_002891 [Paspalum notatum var. saurae]|uniref:Reverse transcriptase Ty1/copia-type domain-containing protein n=1 Tax=Paspalum notatum var. saurae TaxID=547442 RepID=A0AAQ3SJG9_PASNO
MDVKSAFPNGFIEEEVYVRQPPGFESAGFPDRVYKLRKALYGLKQAPRAWYARLKSFRSNLVFFERMSGEFEMSLMGELRSSKAPKDPLSIKQSTQGTYSRIQTRHLMPMKMGRRWTEGISRDDRLTSYSTATRPDIQFVVRLCARYRTSPRTSHRQAVKHIFRYSKFTPKLGLWYSSCSSLFLRGFSDADHAGCRIDRKSTSGTCQLLGTSLSLGPPASKLVYSCLPRSEYIGSLAARSRLLWMKATLSDFGLSGLYFAISVAKNPVLHSRTKHIDVRFHFLRDHYEKGDIGLVHVASENQLANIFTKPLELQVEGIDNALIKGEIESQWTGLIALLV